MLTDFYETDAGLEVPRATYRYTVTHTHQRRIRVRVMNLVHGRSAWFDDILDGQVSIDVTNREVSRIANLTLLDPARSIGWEPDSPSAVPLHLKRMVQIFYDVLVPGYGWVSCPVFTGPVVEVDRTGAEVSIVAEGKERLALHSFGSTHTWKKRRKVVDVIREILELAGESTSRIHLPNLNATLPKDFTVTVDDKPWVQARKLARSVDRVLFYDGRGHARMRKQPTRHSITFDSDWLLAPMQIDRPKLEFKNRWIILGPKPKGDKPRVRADVWLPRSNPFSAVALARNGKPRWLIHKEERPNVKTNAKAREIAMRLRDRRIRYAADITFDVLPLPCVEEWDLVRVKDPLTGAAVTPLRQATIPLLREGMTVGAVVQKSRVKRKRGMIPGSIGGPASD